LPRHRGGRGPFRVDRSRRCRHGLLSDVPCARDHTWTLPALRARRRRTFDDLRRPGHWCLGGHFRRLCHAAQAFGVGLAPHTVRLRVLDGRRVALHPDPEGQGEVQGLFVRQAQLSSQLVDADFFWQRSIESFGVVVQGSAAPTLRRSSTSVNGFLFSHIARHRRAS